MCYNYLFVHIKHFTTSTKPSYIITSLRKHKPGKCSIEVMLLTYYAPLNDFTKNNIILYEDIIIPGCKKFPHLDEFSVLLLKSFDSSLLTVNFISLLLKKLLIPIFSIFISILYHKRKILKRNYKNF